MNPRVELLRADISADLAKLRGLEQEYRDLLQRVDLNATSVSPYDKAAVGFYLQNFYNGCENIFKTIARFFENDLQAGSWHRDLLKRMVLEIQGIRPRVIDDDLHVTLDDFRAFRHRFRHCYSFELDWDRERLVAAKLVDAHAALVRQVTSFLARLEALDG